MTDQEFRNLALAFNGVTEAPHFDRTAFKARRIFASLAADGTSANLFLTPEEQEHLIERFPDSLAPVANKWGARGWSTLTLAAVDAQTVQTLLTAAFDGSR